MTENPITVDRETSILEAMGIMKENNIRRLPVVDKGRLVGMVTERMILEAFPSPAMSLSIHQVRYLIETVMVKDIMLKNPITIPPGANFKDVLLLCQQKRIGALPVVDKGKLVEIATESEISHRWCEGVGRRQTTACPMGFGNQRRATARRQIRARK
jgi:acetoin utilization protein AcuB